MDSLDNENLDFQDNYFEQLSLQEEYFEYLSTCIEYKERLEKILQKRKKKPRSRRNITEETGLPELAFREETVPQVIRGDGIMAQIMNTNTNGELTMRTFNNVINIFEIL